jgi:arylsulfatase A-like enzyme
MLGNHNPWSKPPMFEWSAKIPMFLVGAKNSARVPDGLRDDRLAELSDVMPTLLALCDLPVPSTVEGGNLLVKKRRDYIYSEHFENDMALRMIRAGDWKLIWYPVGNRKQLFNIAADPQELRDLSEDAASAPVIMDLSARMVENLWGGDLKWIKDGQLAGEPDKPFVPTPDYGLIGQRGWRI